MTPASFFVYYRIDPRQREALRAALPVLFAALRARCGVAGRSMHRRDDPLTFMEIYEAVADAQTFAALLEEEAARAGVTACLADGAARHAEIFVAADRAG